MAVEVKAGCGEGGPGESVKNRRAKNRTLKEPAARETGSRVKETKKGGTAERPDNMQGYETKGGRLKCQSRGCWKL